MNNFWSSQDSIKTKKYKVRIEKTLRNIYGQQRMITLPINRQEKKMKHLIKVEQKSQNTFHRRGTWITFEYTKRCTDSLATPEVYGCLNNSSFHSTVSARIWSSENIHLLLMKWILLQTLWKRVCQCIVKLNRYSSASWYIY